MPPETHTSTMSRARRLPRFHRAAHEERPSFRLTDRDRELLKVIYDYRFITAEMIQDLVQPVALTPRQQEAVARLRAASMASRSAPDAFEQHPAARTRRVILHRLMVLFHNGYLQRRKLSDNESIAYSLGNKGADELTLYYGIDRQKIEWTTKNREVHGVYVRHSLMISCFRHALALALRQRPETRLAFWEPAGSFKVSTTYQEERTVRERGGERTTLVAMPITVIPDAYFCLHDGDDELYFFLEADRSTMTNDRFRQKLVSYYKFWQHEIYKQPENRYQLPNFRVLTLTISKERRDNLRTVAKTVDDKRQGTGQFWFLCEKDYRDTPLSIFQPLWKTAKDERMHELLEES